MAQVSYAAEALVDLERVIEHLLKYSPDTASAALERIQGAIQILQNHPEIGRRVDRERRELVISRGSSGYLALYRFDPARDLVRILRVRHQREAGYPG